MCACVGAKCSCIGHAMISLIRAVQMVIYLNEEC